VLTVRIAHPIQGTDTNKRPLPRRAWIVALSMYHGAACSPHLRTTRCGSPNAQLPRNISAKAYWLAISRTVRVRLWTTSEIPRTWGQISNRPGGWPGRGASRDWVKA